MRKALATAFVCCVALTLQSCGQDEPATEPTAETQSPAVVEMTRTPAPPGAAVFFITPGDGDTVTSPLAVKFGVSGIAVTNAGNNMPNSGHHHLIIDTSLENPELPVPSDAQHLHFGKGQTETTLELEPGTHSLQLVLGDANHVPHDPPIMSNTITITVE